MQAGQLVSRVAHDHECADTVSGTGTHADLVTPSIGRVVDLIAALVD